MTSPEIDALAGKLITEIERLIPSCLENPADRNNSQGNVTLFIVAEGGQIFGRMFGTEANRRRGTSRVAWQKASQTWVTGYPTGRYEELVYGKKIDASKFGIPRPEFIGWEGGWPVVAADGTKFAVAVSGFTGETDSAIIRRAVAQVPGLAIAES